MIEAIADEWEGVNERTNEGARETEGDKKIGGCVSSRR